MTVPRLLQANYSHHGLLLDLHGYMDEDGYCVTLATVPGALVSVNADADLLAYFSGWCDDRLPSSEELRAQSEMEAAIEAYEWHRALGGAV